MSKRSASFINAESLVGGVIVFLIILASDVGNVFGKILLDDYTSNYIGQAAFILSSIVSIPFIHKISYYYLNNWRLEDTLIFIYVFFVFLNKVLRNASTDLHIFPILELLFCFYIIPYFLRKIEEKIAFGIGIVGFIVITTVTILSILLSPSLLNWRGLLTFGMHPNAAARDIFVLLISLYLISYILGVKRVTIKVFILFVSIGLIYLIILTASFQVIIIGVLGSISIRKIYQKRLLANKKLESFYLKYGFTFVALPLLFIYIYESEVWIYVYQDQYSRIIQYNTYLRYLYSNMSSYVISGQNISDLFRYNGENVRISGVAIGSPHNAILEVLLKYGFLSAVAYLSFHVKALYEGIKIAKKTKSKLLIDILSVSTVIFIISLFDNFLPKLAGSISYVLYVMLGLLLNFARSIK